MDDKKMTINMGDYTGYSNSSISEAIQQALQKAGEHVRFEIIETRGSQLGNLKSCYEATLTTFSTAD